MKTIKVRIAVAVADNGWWNAVGWQRTEQSEGDKVLASFARQHLLNRPSAVHFVEAELPVPEAETFQGAVVKEGAT